MVRRSPFDFELPDALSAQEPPEKRGLPRVGIRLLSANRSTGALTHARFHQLADFLEPGDCLVFNASRTLPASLEARLESTIGTRLQLRLARRLDSSAWSALVLGEDDEPWREDLQGAHLT